MTWQPQPHLAEAAAHERDLRERHFPALIESGRAMKDEAEAEIAAWRAIADLIERGSTERDFSWSTLHLFTTRHLQALAADVEKAESGGSAKLGALRERLAKAHAIHRPIDRMKFLIDDTNTILRRRALASQEAAA